VLAASEAREGLSKQDQVPAVEMVAENGCSTPDDQLQVARSALSSGRQRLLIAPVSVNDQRESDLVKAVQRHDPPSAACALRARGSHPAARRFVAP
jgi:hypothetical protein